MALPGYDRSSKRKGGQGVKHLGKGGKKKGLGAGHASKNPEILLQSARTDASHGKKASMSLSTSRSLHSTEALCKRFGKSNLSRSHGLRKKKGIADQL